MQENKRNIDDFLRDELGSYAETPPPAAWENLEKKLELTRPGKGMRFRRWWWIVPALVFVTGVAFLAANNIKTHSVNTQKPVADHATEAPVAIQPLPVRNLPAAKPDTSSPVKTNSKHPKTQAASHTDTMPAAVASAVLRHVANDTSTRKPIKSHHSTGISVPGKQHKNSTVKVAMQNGVTSDTTLNRHSSAAHKKGHKPVIQNVIVDSITGETFAVKPATVKHHPGKKSSDTAVASGRFTVADSSHNLTGKASRRAKKKWMANTASSPSQRQQANVFSTSKKYQAIKTAATKIKTTDTVTAAADGKKPLVKVASAKEGTKKQIVVKPAKEKIKTAKQVVAVKETASKKKEVKPAARNKNNAGKTAIAVSEPKQSEVPFVKTSKPAITDNVTPATKTPIAPVTPAGRPQNPAPAVPNKTVAKDETRQQDTSGNNKKIADTTGQDIDPFASLHPPKEKRVPRFEAGIKAAYSIGLTQFPLNKITAMPYVQLNINNKLSLVLHLGFSYGQMPKTDLADWQSYYKINGSFFSHTTTLDTITQDTAYHYTYRQSRDSFSAKYTVSRTVWETELPVLLKYRLGGGFSVFGGPVFTFGKIVQITGTKGNTATAQITDTLSSHTLYPQSFFENRNRPSGEPDSVYTANASQYQNPSSTPLRFGYMLGFSYDAGKRFVIDLSVQQILSGASYIPDPDIRKTYTSPYVRMSVGFKIFKSKH